MKPILGSRGAVVASHSLAAQAGLDILREGGNAIEATIAVASTLAVVYPHMTGIGGDGFWLLHAPGQAIRSIDACGGAGHRVTPALYPGLENIPWRGPLAANTVAGTVSGWGIAHAYSQSAWGGRLPLSRLLESAIHYAREGFPVTHSQQENTRAKLAELQQQPGFAQAFLDGGEAPAYGQRHRFPELAATLEQIGRAGADDFYRGELAASIAADLARVGSPLDAADLAAHRAELKDPLSVELSVGTVFNQAPPTQGVASLLILAIYDRIRQAGWSPDNVEGIHALVEATKQAFLLRDRHVGDPATMARPVAELLDSALIRRLADAVPLDAASPWPAPVSDGDTTWLGVIDAAGRAVSMIQSIYFEFGSGVVLPGTGICWQNRGCSFDLHPHRLRSLVPGRKPFHTLNPAMARLKDGRLLVYGTMGGEGQPQTQAAVFSRYVWGGHDIRSAVAAPRWLLGRTWAEQSTTLKLESRYPAAVIERLRAMGHPVELAGDFDERMGHAGALVLHPDGHIEGGEDPRSDGCVAAW
ncbi:MAG: gamma-glutamyltransferase [Candidatus Dactylopiibacterium carminicum]|uniref:Gamma-glutamyltransferase n=1 Tax=Candidatus Dactylopiibacterium carminicum TaxID=857335 RepID=A0A272ESG7_9RHOO|nr:gamma-glutamyltransferase family protein [Candidatus Dactylopiibacterium carminicum]KAF7599030.1 gamma-glutamyltransferase family protein [Candidatus Dactylopiibacterium carminicum]PAS93035.1 MAG: gamma-glutamyltransferase [Candidatus Dactylopiibacterium carminicum]PAS96709.1 MAG: gamma-glutamyltransferase [Candidatus Dactylopiibacterium carminicum]PAS99044.1 MAG: gamma-glutamyltransferase [Candidatus Dactylopiibacterium carminicum]